MSFQKTILCGEVTTEPELRHNTSGIACCAFRLKTVDVYTGHDGQLKEDVETHRILAWAHEAERISKTFKKGHIVLVEGKLKTRKLNAENGIDLEITEVIPIPKGVRFLGGSETPAHPAKNPTAKAPESPGAPRAAPFTPPVKPTPPPPATPRAKAESPIKPAPPAPPKPDKVPVDLSASDDLPF